VGIAMLLAWCSALIVSPVDLASLVRLQWKNVLMGGIGLFGVYIGFYLMFTRYGVSSYILYAVLSILTTTVVVGILWLREPINGLRIASIVLATAAVVLYSLSETSHG
jgi:drug/metabolite transporter (DMT)-like permease